jgi:hypothetical protein
MILGLEAEIRLGASAFLPRFTYTAMITGKILAIRSRAYRSSSETVGLS